MTEDRSQKNWFHRQVASIELSDCDRCLSEKLYLKLVDQSGGETINNEKLSMKVASESGAVIQANLFRSSERWPVILLK